MKFSRGVAALWAVAFLLALIIPGTNLVGLYAGTTNAIDFSIYQEAIYRLSTFESFNPYVFVRNVHIFNDHFDPVIFIPALLLSLTSKSPEALLFYEFLMWAIPLLAILYFSRKQDWKKQESLLSVFAYLGLKGLLTGLNYPIHPSTWSLVPFFFIGYFLAKKKYHALIPWGLFLILHKESYSFALFPMCFMGIFIDKKSRFPLIILGVLSLLFMAFELKFKELLIGDTVNYGGRFLGPLLNSPLDFLQERLLAFDPKPLLKIYYPFFLPFYFLLKDQRTNRSLRPFLICSSLLAPLIFLHFLSNSFHFQYGAQFVAPLFGLLIGLRFFSISMPAKKWGLILVLFYLSSLSVYSKSIRTLLSSDSRFQSRSQEHRQLNDFFDKTGVRKILSTGGVVPHLVRVEREVYHLGGFSKKDPLLKWGVLEKPGVGDPFPLTKEKIYAAIKKCQKDKNVSIEFETVSYRVYFAPHGLQCLYGAL